MIGVAKGGRQFALVGALTGTGGLGTATELHRKGKRDEARDAAAAAAGGWAGQGIYQGTGYGAKWRAQAKKEPLASRAQRDKALKSVKRKHGAYTPAMERHFPSSLPEFRTHRVLGWTHRGRTGTALGTATTLGGSAVAIRANERKKVSKAREYGYRERTLSPVRATEGVAGVSLLAWGGSRLPLSGAAAYGQRLADRHGGGKEAAAALELARSIGTRAHAVTGHGEQLARGVKGLDRAIDKVPANLRPSVAVAAGALLVARARPVHNERFVAERRL